MDHQQAPVSHTFLGLDFKDQVAALPKITQLFDKLQEAVCGTEKDGLGRSGRGDPEHISVFHKGKDPPG